MGILQHETSAIGQTGSVKSGETTVTALPPPDNVSAVPDQSPDRTIVVDGPLSTVYTNALNELFANKIENKLGQESQQIDSVVLAGVHNLRERREKNKDEIINGAYVYLTDDEHLEKDGVAGAYDSLRIALDMKNINHKVLCIESYRPTKKTTMLIQYALENHVKVFFVRERLLDHLKDL